MNVHGDENTKVLLLRVQIKLEAFFLLKLMYPSLQSNTKMTTRPILCNAEKTRMCQGKTATAVRSISVLNLFCISLHKRLLPKLSTMYN